MAYYLYHQMSLSNCKQQYTNNCLYFLKRTVPYNEKFAFTLMMQQCILLLNKISPLQQNPLKHKVVVYICYRAKCKNLLIKFKVQPLVELRYKSDNTNMNIFFQLFISFFVIHSVKSFHDSFWRLSFRSFLKEMGNLVR